ncbi:hypothetical protein CYLTODRAFT_485568 [Cylindrobasidium torrendii FP15055 ss-10]|uniref:Uncharacterized protein n=1 Tax=Cylindrobasidium torrendii FP15055 ss-10 TaxID=1314674 RepID=A0A0D7BTC1_9AGAR|nr:hypothetical protein CYLTODRAFT_485568 [Cylindrobasidium torrendii FP15055 ss-10]
MNFESCSRCSAHLEESARQWVPLNGPDIPIEFMETNTAPSSSFDLAGYHRDLHALTRQRDEVDDCITALEASLAVWRVRKVHLDKTINNAKRVVHPIRNLPDDVLYTIIDYCVPKLSSLDLPAFSPVIPDSLGVDSPLTILSAVCKTWRAAILSNACLWSEVYVDISLWTSITAASVAERFEWALSHSRDCNLRFVIDLWMVDSRHDWPLLRDRLASMLHTSAFRIQTLGLLNIPTDTLQGLWPSTSTWRLPRMRHLRLVAAQKHPIPDPFLEMFFDAPLLQTYEQEGALPINIPVQQLQRCSLQNSQLPQIRSLSHASKLQLLSIDSESITILAPEPVLLPSLETLVMNNIAQLSDVLECIQAPSLRRLLLRIHANVDEDLADCRELPNVEDATIVYESDSPPSIGIISAFFRRTLPNVTRLRLYFRHADYTLGLFMLEELLAGKDILQHMRSLDMDASAFGEDSDVVDEVVAALKVRAIGGLTTLRVRMKKLGQQFEMEEELRRGLEGVVHLKIVVDEHPFGLDTGLHSWH